MSGTRPFFAVRRSMIHGRGGFAIRRIRKGVSFEYLGERISQAECDRRHAKKSARDNHTFMFNVCGHCVIDGGVKGNAVRFLNHSCQGNCESVIYEDGRVFIEALKNIQPGVELTYDYRILREPKDGPAQERKYACRCGAPKCRGTMLGAKKRAR